MVDEYIPRVVDGFLESRLKRPVAVVIKGPKYSGKTRTGERFCASVLYLSDRSTKTYVETSSEAGSRAFLEGAYPRLIDEWQVVPDIWDMVKFSVDHDSNSRYVLTGSSTPAEDRILHPGTGRFSTVTMHTMSLFESGDSQGTISLKEMFDGGRADGHTDLNYDGLVSAICRGGWPAAVANDDEPGATAEDYVGSLIEYDMPRMFGKTPALDEDGHAAEPSGQRLETIRTVTSRTMQSIARNISMATPVSTILSDVNSQSNLVSGPTFQRYLENLDRMFVTDNLEAWNPHMRSRTKLRTKPKWHFCDPSLAVAAMGSSPGRLARDTETMGLLFESLCLHDLRVYLQPLKGKAYYIGDHNGYEVDIIVELPDGRWGAFEVKLGSSEFDKAAANLLKLKRNVDTSKVGEPSFLAILTGVQFGYTRTDGVSVVPLGCLGP